MEKHGRATGVLIIGQSGENLCNIATVVAQKGRAGGRPGMGAVMGSKNLKALIFNGTKEVPAAHPEELKKLGKEGFDKIPKFDAFPYWKKVGTMMAADMMQTASARYPHATSARDSSSTSIMSTATRYTQQQ